MECSWCYDYYYYYYYRNNDVTLYDKNDNIINIHYTLEFVACVPHASWFSPRRSTVDQPPVWDVFAQGSKPAWSRCVQNSMLQTRENNLYVRITTIVTWDTYFRDCSIVKLNQSGIAPVSYPASACSRILFYMSCKFVMKKRRKNK